MRRTTWLSLLAAVVLAGSPAAVEGHVNDPSTERGFKPDAVYDFNGLDNVNAFNGNLSLVVPIGPRYPLGGGMSFGLSLTYSSELWDFDYADCGQNNIAGWRRFDQGSSFAFTCATKATLAYANAGLGWRLELGSVRAPDPSAGLGSPVWEYWRPDGGRVGFYPTLHANTPPTGGNVFYSRDGSYLRLEMLSATEARIDFPDGQVHRFMAQEEEIAPPGLAVVEIEDPLGNGVVIDYNATDWTIDDKDPASSRTWVVNFLDGWVSSIALPKVGGGSVTYTLHNSTSMTLAPGCPHNFDEGGDGQTDWQTTRLLTRLDFPVTDEGLSFAYLQTEAGLGGPAWCSRVKGRLEAATLPTGATIAYQYGAYRLPRYPRCGDSYENPPPDDRDIGGLNPTQTASYGVTRRSITLPGASTAHSVTDYRGTHGQHWGFAPRPTNEPTPFFPNPRPVERDIGADGADLLCNLPTSTYTDVFEDIKPGLRRRTRQWFSVFTHSLDAQDHAEGWRPEEFGLPLNRTVAFPGDVLPVDQATAGLPTAYLSTATYECDGQTTQPEGPAPPEGYDLDGCRLAPLRATFVRYEDSGFVCPREQSQGPYPNWAETWSECTENNRRAVAEVTVYYDDDAARPGDSTPASHLMYTFSTKTEFDGFGHYRTAVTDSNFAPSLVPTKDPKRTTFTNYNPGVVYGTHGSSVSLPAASSVWLRNLFNRQDRWLRDEHSDKAVEAFTFTSATGLLTEKRTYRGTSSGPTDFKTVYTYDTDGNLTQESHFGGKAGVNVEQFRTKHAYTAGVRRLTEAVDPVTQQVVLRSLDLTIDAATGRPTLSRDMAGVATAFTYDGLFRTLSEVPLHGGEAGTFYAFTPADGPTGAVVTVERRLPGSPDALTHEQHHYDGLGRVARQVVKRPSGALVEKCNRYLPQGWLEKTSVWRSASQGCAGTPVWEAANTYDVLGRVTRVDRPDGSETTIDHAGIRERYETTTPLAAAPGVSASAYRRLRFDSVGNLSNVDEPSRPDNSEAKTEYFYDEANRVVKVRTRYVGGSGEYQERLFDYDGAGVLLSEQHPEMGREVLVNGQPVFEQYTWGYGDHDALRNPGTKLLLPGVGQKYSLGYRYDRASRLSQVYLAKSDNPYWRLLKQFSYANDETALASGDLAQGKMVAAKRHHVRFENPGGYVDREVVTETFEYAGLGGRLSRQEVRTGGAGEVPRVRFASSYGYDSLGNLTQLRYPECNFARCGFEQAGQLISVAPERIQAFGYSQGVLTSVSGFADAITYHSNGQLAQVLHHNQVADVVTDDPNGLPRPRRIATQNVNGTAWDSGLYSYDGSGNISAIGADSFAYDRVNRLRTSATTFQGVTHNQAFTYDLFGNLTSMGASGNLGTRTFTVDERTNHLTGNASVGFLYDPVGNLSLPGWTYDYDAFTLLLSSQGSGTPKKYLYTAADERVATLVVGPPTDSVTERWTLRAPGNGVLRDFERLSDSSWRLKSEYVHRGGQLLAEVRYDGAAAPQVRHLHLDHLGTPRQVTGANRAVLAEYKYLPFGEQLGSPTAEDTRLKFTGHERDDLDPSGQLGDLDYMHARYYTPLWGRFLSLDPGRDWDPMQPQSWNLYTYVRNRPVIASDPDGEALHILGGALLGGLVKGGLEIYRQHRAGEATDWNKIRASAAGGVLEGAIGAATGGASFAFRLSVGVATDVTSGAMERAADNDESTGALDPKELVTDAVVGGVSNRLALGAEAKVLTTATTSQTQRQLVRQADHQVRASAQRSAGRQAPAIAFQKKVAGRPARLALAAELAVDKSADAGEKLVLDEQLKKK